MKRPGPKARAAASRPDGAAVIAATYARWPGYQGYNERDVFGTTDPTAIVAAVDAFCRRELSSGVARYEFYATSVCSVHGLRLEDGRGVVVKVHRAEADVAHLEAVHAVQRHLVAAGFPAPVPVRGPARLAAGIAVVDGLLDRGGWQDAHEPRVRRLVAQGLAQQIESCRDLGAVAGLKTAALVRRQLWARPHDRRFDFAATAAGAEWIHELATEAHRRLDDAPAGGIVAGHNDWRVEHLRFRGGRLSAVWDWDSLSVAAEPVYAGSAAHGFVADYTVDALACVPTTDESLAFVADYEAARGAAFSPAERCLADAALVAMLAYSARCEHADALTGVGAHRPDPPPVAVPPDSFRAAIAQLGPSLLGISVLRVPPVDDA